MILGHAHPEVVEAVQKTMIQSSSFGAPTPAETLLAEEIVRRVAVVDRVRIVSSGTEATMTAIRLARAATGRDIIVKFVGCYHGHSDSLLVQAGSGIVTLGLPNSPGVTTGATADTICVEYGDRSLVEGVFHEYSNRIAAVITEAAPANMGVIDPPAGFNSFLRDITARNGAMLIFDEVMTGFRVGLGGWWSRFESSPAPDLFAFGKVIGGGFPLAAVAGTAAAMDQLAPVGSVYQAGTLSGNPVAATAGLVTLQQLNEESYVTLDETAEKVRRSVSAALTSAGIPHTAPKAGNLFSFFFSPDVVHNMSDARQQDEGRFARFFNAMLRRGVYIPPSAYEAWFVSTAHDSRALEIIDAASKEAALEASA
jgi:glutamate-1-semialdehyde 2,1-aminomutase